MFDKNTDDRLSSWADHRAALNVSDDPVNAVWEFWKNTPYIPYNHKIDPYHPRSWPSPWEIIVDNHYDDFTKALMIGLSLKLTENYKNWTIELKTLVDKSKPSVYNIVYVNNTIAINYSDLGPVSADLVPDSLVLENLIEVTWPR